MPSGYFRCFPFSTSERDIRSLVDGILTDSVLDIYFLGFLIFRFITSVKKVKEIIFLKNSSASPCLLSHLFHGIFDNSLAFTQRPLALFLNCDNSLPDAFLGSNPTLLPLVLVGQIIF